MIKLLNKFDYLDNVRYSKGCKLCTREIFERMSDDVRVRDICQAVAETRAKETSQTSEEERKNLKETANRIKIEDKVILPHGHSESGRRGNDYMTPSPWCCMDIDDIENPRGFFETIRSGLEALNCPLAFVSPSGRGIKFLLPMVEGMDRKEAQKYFADVLHLPSYDSTPDLARCCFMVPRENWLIYIPELLFANEVELLPNPSGAGAIVPAEEVIHPQLEDAEVIEDKSEEQEPVETVNAEPSYHGIPITRIIEAYWIVNNNGQAPKSGERNDLTYELALGLRHICDYNRDVMLRVIPCYDGLPDEERINCIDSALKRPRSKMPLKMVNTLNYLRKEERDNADFQQFILDFEEEDNSYYFRQIRTAFAQPSARIKGLPKRELGQLPAGMRETLEPFPDDKAMPVIIATATMIGVLGNDVRLHIRDDEPKALNLQCYVVGNSGSGKSKIDKVDEFWMKNWREKQAIEIEKERVYAEAKRTKRNAKEMPKDPKAHILELSFRTSTSMALIRLENANGDMCYSYLQEADMGTASGGQSFNADLGVIQRCSYDESKYDTSYLSLEIGMRYVPHVRWNFVKCCTPDALYRAQKGFLNGEINRLAIGSMPDNTFAPFRPMKERSDKSIQSIENYSKLIPYMQGTVRLPLLERVGCEWQERIRQTAARNDDVVMARERMRIPTTAERICCAMMLPVFARWLMAQLDERKGELPKWAGGCKTAEIFLLTHPDALSEFLPKFQNDAWCKVMECLCDYLHEQILIYFRAKIQKCLTSSESYVTRTRKSTNDSIFDQLPDEFGDAELLNLKQGSKEAARSLRRRWIQDGFIKPTETPGRYIKLAQ